MCRTSTLVSSRPRALRGRLVAAVLIATACLAAPLRAEALTIPYDAKVTMDSAGITQTCTPSIPSDKDRTTVRTDTAYEATINGHYTMTQLLGPYMDQFVAIANDPENSSLKLWQKGLWGKDAKTYPVFEFTVSLPAGSDAVITSVSQEETAACIGGISSKVSADKKSVTFTLKLGDVTPYEQGGFWKASDLSGNKGLQGNTSQKVPTCGQFWNEYNGSAANANGRVDKNNDASYIDFTINYSGTATTGTTFDSVASAVSMSGSNQLNYYQVTTLFGRDFYVGPTKVANLVADELTEPLYPRPASSGLRDFTVSYASDNAEVALADAKYDAATVTEGDEVQLPAAPVSPKWAFDGWRSSADQQLHQAGDRIVVTADTTLTAEWSLRQFKVSYSSGTDDYSLADDPNADAYAAQTLEYGSQVTLPAAPSWAHHTFLGWVIGRSAKVHQPGAVVELTEDMPVTATWSDVSTLEPWTTSKLLPGDILTAAGETQHQDVYWTTRGDELSMVEDLDIRPIKDQIDYYEKHYSHGTPLDEISLENYSCYFTATLTLPEGLRFTDGATASLGRDPVKGGDGSFTVTAVSVSADGKTMTVRMEPYIKSIDPNKDEVETFKDLQDIVYRAQPNFTITYDHVAFDDEAVAGQTYTMAGTLVGHLDADAWNDRRSEVLPTKFVWVERQTPEGADSTKPLDPDAPLPDIADIDDVDPDTFFTVGIAQHKVTYDLAGGTGDATTQTGEKNQSLTTHVAPTRDGFRFDGWSDGAATYAAGSELTLGDSDVALTALWTKLAEPVTPTAAFYRTEYWKQNLDGTYTRADGETVGAMGEIGSTVNAAPTKTFEHYHENPDAPDTVLSGTVVMPTAVEGGEPQVLTLRRYYDLDTFVVTYDLGGAEGDAPASVTSPYGGTVTIAAAPTRAGFRFDGWSDGTATYPADAPITVTGNVTLTAQWTRMAEPVQPTAAMYRTEYWFQTLDGSYVKDPGETVAAMGEPGSTVEAAEAKAFLHYHENPDAPDAALSGTVVMPSMGPNGEPQFLTLRRYYDLDVCTASYDLAGGTGDAESQQAPYGGTVATHAAPTRDGYTFVAWTLADGTVVAPGSDLLLASDVTLTATWEKNPEPAPNPGPATGDGHDGSGQQGVGSNAHVIPAGVTPATGDAAAPVAAVALAGAAVALVSRRRASRRG